MFSNMNTIYIPSNEKSGRQGRSPPPNSSKKKAENHFFFFFKKNCYKHDGYVLNCMWGNSKSYIFDKNFNHKLDS